MAAGAIVAVVLSTQLRRTASFWPALDRNEMCIAPILPPVARSKAENQHRNDVDDVLGRFWRGLGGFAITDTEVASVNNAGVFGHHEKSGEDRRPSTYGEVTPIGVRQIGRKLGIDELNGDDRFVFMDLGSGVGKVVAQVYFEWPLVMQAVGVELSASRVRRARQAWEAAVSSGEAPALRRAALALREDEHSKEEALAPAVDAPVSFVEGDLLAADISNVTHVYVASLCFGDGLLRKLAHKLAAEGTRLRAVAALRQFPSGIAGFEEVDVIHADMSWTKGLGTRTFIYRRHGAVQSRVLPGRAGPLMDSHGGGDGSAKLPD